MAAFTGEDPDDRCAFDAHMAMVRSSPGITFRAVTCDGRLVGSIASFVFEGQTEVTYWMRSGRASGTSREMQRAWFVPLGRPAGNDRKARSRTPRCMIRIPTFPAREAGFPQAAFAISSGCLAPVAPGLAAAGVDLAAEVEHLVPGSDPDLTTVPMVVPPVVWPCRASSLQRLWLVSRTDPRYTSPCCPGPRDENPVTAAQKHLGENIRSCRCQLAFDWLISTRWPSGSRRKQRISELQSCGGVRNVAPLDRSAS